MRSTLLAVALFAAAGCASAPDDGRYITIRDVEYREGATVLKGHLAMPERTFPPRPAVLVVHEWWGRGAHSDKSAEDLARLGYVGFAIDMYGDGASTTDAAKAGEWSGAIKKDPALGIRRFRAALDYVRGLPEVNPTRVAAIGYCFGGTVSLDAAWAGIDLRGVVSFHGGLTTPTAAQADGVKASILVCHGADDPLASEEVVDGFEKSMRENKFDWELVQYGGAVHSFTNPAADGSFNPGVKYNATAAARSWEVMQSFLAERFRQP
jgi:dienelactone hydrolase